MSLDKHERRAAAWIEEGDRPEDPKAIPRSGTRDLPIATRLGYRSDFDHGAAPDDQVSRSGATESELRQRYPENRWDGPWGDKALTELEALLGENDALLGEDPVRLSPLDAARAVQQTAERDGERLDAPLGSHESLEDIAERVDRQLAAIRKSPVTGPVNGQAILPGSVPTSALAPRAFGAASALPGPGAAVTLRLAPDPDTDHWAVDGSAVGPGRIWRVTSVQEGPDFQPDGGPIRFRLVANSQQFRVVSVELQHAGISSGSPILQTNYGLFVRGIPTYGLRPSLLVGAIAEGDYPISYATEEVLTGGSPDGPYSLMGAAAEGRYQTTSPPFMDELDSSTYLSPQAGGIADCDGFAFGLITGETDEAVYRQVNTRATTYGRVWRKDGVVEGLTIPSGGTVRPPCPGQTIKWNGLTGASAGYDESSQNNTMTENQLVEGIPLLYPDCAALARKRESFSMFVQPLVIRSKTLSSGNTWSTPPNWASYGMETVAGVGRTWALDLIVH